MIEIELIGRGVGIFALVDDDDHSLVSQYRWCLHTARGSLTRYARASVASSQILMHRLIMDPPRHLVVDHIDGNGLNNQRSNLRITDQRTNISAGVARRAFDRYEDKL